LILNFNLPRIIRSQPLFLAKNFMRTVTIMVTRYQGRYNI
jgi:hypothetical protein